MLAQLISADLFAALLVFVRLGGALMIIPGFGEIYVPARVRLGLAVALTIVVAPLVSATLPPLPAAPLQLALFAAGELVVGLLIGTTARLLLSALHVTVELIEIIQIIEKEALLMLVVTVVAVGIIAAADIVYQRFDHIKNLRMSKQEVKDEHKQSEGDPMVKARIRSIRVERARKRMMAAVPTADVVITNPTHYAVALEYKPQIMAAPRVVAKGVDAVALRIRSVAEEHGVPIVENPPVARALYATCELDQEVPVEHYKAVAEVISYVMRLRGKSRPRGTGPSAVL